MPYIDRLIVYTANIRLGLECLRGATTLAYFSHDKISKIKQKRQLDGLFHIRLWLDCLRGATTLAYFSHENMEDYMDCLLAYIADIKIGLECLARATTLANLSHGIIFPN